MEGPWNYSGGRTAATVLRSTRHEGVRQQPGGHGFILGKRLAHLPWGKHLVLPDCDMFALRVHFLLWGTFAATVNGASVTGDYRRAGRPRLVLEFANGEITMWSASLRILDGRTDAREEYDFTTDILSESWNRRSALRKVKTHGREEIADVLLDQSIFAGVGNIIKNEVLFPHPDHRRESQPTLIHPAATNCRRGARILFRFLELRRILRCASAWKSMDAARARRAGAKFPARSTASAAAAVFSARSASTRAHGEAMPQARRQRPLSDVAHGVHAERGQTVDPLWMSSLLGLDSH